MTNVNQATKFYLPFALPKYGNAMQQNAYYVQSAGQYLAPMRSFAFSVIEHFGGVPVHTETRHHNIEFKVANGQHFMQILKAMGINITHMLEVPGGFKSFKNGDMSKSVCFIQKKTTRGTGHIEYTAVLAMRHVTHELFIGVFPPQANQAPQQQPVDNFMQEALGEAPAPQEVLPPVREDDPRLPENQVSASQLPFPEVTVTADDLPAGL